jgi:tetratricopeptide (TPR) repeat protein
LLIAEGLLWATNQGTVSEIEDPFVGFDEIHPLFVLDENEANFVTAPARENYFRPESFSARRPANEFRIFCLGGSTVQGRPYAIETSFTSWLELSLKAADPSHPWEVVNCGGISYASYRLAPIVRELLDKHQPNLLVLYTGHNEFLEDRTYDSIKRTSPIVAGLHGWASRSRLYNSCRSAWLRMTGGNPLPTEITSDVLPSEVDAILDHYGGLADYHRDDAWRNDATEHYRFNLMRMVQEAKAAAVPVILVNPVVNLRDCPPFKVEHKTGLSAQDLAEFDTLWEQARNCEDMSERARLLERALDIDERFAAAHFALGKCYDSAREYDKAKTAYVRAKEEDTCPLRMIESQYDALRDVARQTGTPLVDARGFSEANGRNGIPGDDWLLDHVHPSINGHQEIASLLLAEMVRMRLLEPLSNWEPSRDALYREHLEALEDAYFVHGRQRLEGLIRWTQGRAEGRRGRRLQNQPTEE